MEKVVVAVFGKDRPGIVCKISSVLAEHGCNIEDISQTVLQGEFCGMFVVSLGPGLDDLKLQHLLQTRLESEHLKVFTKKLEMENGESEIEKEDFVVVSIGKDRVGLIAAISCIMYEFGVNIANLKFVNRTPSFPDKTMTIYEVEIPKSVKLPEFAHALRKKANELELDITIQHKKIFEELSRI